MGALQVARQAKHVAFVARKRSRRGLKQAKFDVATRVFRGVERVRPFVYDPSRYRGTFLDRDVVPAEVSEFPRRVFAIWAGDNPLTENRSRSLDRIRSTIGLPVELVTPDNLHEWLIDGHPLHPAYADLSLIHRSDYLRGYLMHHHGGGYVDIKTPIQSWAPSFDAMASEPDAWVTSYSTTHANWIGKLPGRLGADILVRYRLMFGKGAMLMRSRTSLTAEWLAEMDRRLDDARDSLSQSTGDVFGGDGYPLSWTDLLGRTLDPLTLKYTDHIRLDDRMLLDFTNYR